MTRDEYLAAYCERAGVTPEFLELWAHPVRCDCVAADCDGWVMAPLEWETANGPHQPTLGKCKSCGAAVMWCQTVKRRAIPLDPHPHPEGNLALETANRDGSGARRAVHVRPDERAGEPRYRSHFVTCPQAAEHRTS